MIEVGVGVTLSLFYLFIGIYLCALDGHKKVDTCLYDTPPIYLRIIFLWPVVRQAPRQTDEQTNTTGNNYD